MARPKTEIPINEAMEDSITELMAMGWSKEDIAKYWGITKEEVEKYT